MVLGYIFNPENVPGRFVSHKSSIASQIGNFPPTRPTSASPITRTGVAMILRTVAGKVLGAQLGQAAIWLCSVQKLHFPCNPYLSTRWMVQRLTSKRLASYCWLTPFDRSTSDVLPLLPRSGWAVRPGKRPSVRAFAWHGDRALPDRVSPPLAESEHHPRVGAGTGGRGRVEVFRQGPELGLHSRMV